VIKTATIAGAAPWDAEGLDWLAGMGAENAEEFAAVEAGEEALRAWLENAQGTLRDVTGDQVAASLGDLIGEADRAVLTGEFAEYLAASMRAAVSHGVEGWLDDDLASRAHWGFDVGAIDVPVTIWQGDDDRMVPFAHGQWLAAHVQGARAELRPGDGHFSIALAHYGEILDDLLAG
jgi:pimeloyl-ACP methyl ester carboxylesterase